MYDSSRCGFRLYPAHVMRATVKDSKTVPLERFIQRISSRNQNKTCVNLTTKWGKWGSKIASIRRFYPKFVCSPRSRFATPLFPKYMQQKENDERMSGRGVRMTKGFGD